MQDLSFEVGEEYGEEQPTHVSDIEEQDRLENTQPGAEDRQTKDAWEIRVPIEMRCKLAGSWQTSIIIKLMGRQLGYRALQTRLAGIWRPTGKMT